MKKKDNIVILFAGNSGDGIQFIGNLFTKSVFYSGNTLMTLPNFPAEIKYPFNSINGVSSFQINMGLDHHGDFYDILIVMNASSLKNKLHGLKKGGMIIVYKKVFYNNRLKLAKYDDLNYLKFFFDYRIYAIELDKINLNIIDKLVINTTKQQIHKNMLILGCIYYIINIPIKETIKKIYNKFICANLLLLKIGYGYGKKQKMPKYNVKKKIKYKKDYRIINGNQSIVFGLLSAVNKAKLNLFYSGYPITPASDILHYFSYYKKIGIKTFQAEDEIAAITSAIGASYAGNLGVTATSGPGLSLKQEGLGLAFMIELPLVIINVQRGGPSTGLPTKTEQADLLQAIYGRNGEAPIPVFAVKSPSNAFNLSYNAAKIAIEHMTPVIILSDYYLAKGSEIWNIKYYKTLEAILPQYAKVKLLPYKRDNKMVINWAIPGMAGYEKCLGGLEKQDETGFISYNSVNHQKMVLVRHKKINHLIKKYPNIIINSGKLYGNIIIISWGSTYGVIKNALNKILKANIKVAHMHLEYVYPLEPQIGYILLNYKYIIVPELNKGQLVHIIRDYFLINAIAYNKIQGIPLTPKEIINIVNKIYFKKSLF